MKSVFAFPALILLTALYCAPAAAAELVAEFRGTASRVTPEFEVQAPWILDWRVTSEGGFELAVDVSLEHAGTSAHEGNVLKTKWPGNGVRLFDMDGRFQFRVHSSFAKWTLRIEQLTPEEAEAYTPRQTPSPLD